MNICSVYLNACSCSVNTVRDQPCLKDEMDKDLAGTTGEENSAITSFDSLVAAKNKEIQALTKSIQSKTMRIGELG
jgi:hypothetical protein